jgi:hypothetical protein
MQSHAKNASDIGCRSRHHRFKTAATGETALSSLDFL